MDTSLGRRPHHALSKQQTVFFQATMALFANPGAESEYLHTIEPGTGQPMEHISPRRCESQNCQSEPPQ